MMYPLLPMVHRSSAIRIRAPRLALLSLAFFCACGSEESSSGGSSDVLFHAELPTLPGFKHDTGLQPAGSPVQLQLTIASSGQSTVDARAVASGSAEEPVLTAIPASGSVAIQGGFSLEGRLVVNVSGLPSYDGPVPGLKDVNIAYAGNTTFDPYLLKGQSTAKADIPPTELPPIPLPGGLPGNLKLKIAEGSFVALQFNGVCASIQNDSAQYVGKVVRSGSLIIQPTVVLEVPIVGSKSFDLPSVTAPVSGNAEDVDLGTKTVVFVSAPAQAGEEAMMGTCHGGTGGGGGSAGSGGAAGNAGSSGASDAGTDAEDGEASVCASAGLSCKEASCCEGLACVYAGSDLICQTL